MEERTVTTIDITPTWQGLLPGMIAVLQNPKAQPKSHEAIAIELGRMARAADQWNEHVKEQRNA